MARTGYKITVYLDDNPNSETYLQTYEERTEDLEKCPINEDDLILVGNECEIVESGYTGYRVLIYYNRTTGEYSEVKELDPECEATSDEEQWVASGDPFCETTEQGINTGYMLQLLVQKNAMLPNYGATKYNRYKSPECGENNCPIWNDLEKSCHIAVNDCVATFDGTADIMQIDINPLSPTYNQTRTANKQDSDCENCTNTLFDWVLVGEMCGDDDLLCSNGVQQVSTNSYIVYRKYKTIGSGSPIPMDEYQVTLNEEDDEDCGFIRPQYKWEKQPGYLCDYETYTKYELYAKMVSYDEGVTWSIKQPYETQRGEIIAYDSYDCGKPMYRWIPTGEFVCVESEIAIATMHLDDGSTADIVVFDTQAFLDKQVLSSYTDVASAITINDKCEAISGDAFADFTKLETITMESSEPIPIGSLVTKNFDILKIYVPSNAYIPYIVEWDEYEDRIIPIGASEEYVKRSTVIDLTDGKKKDKYQLVITYNGQSISKGLYKYVVIEDGDYSTSYGRYCVVGGLGSDLNTNEYRHVWNAIKSRNLTDKMVYISDLEETNLCRFQLTMYFNNIQLSYLPLSFRVQLINNYDWEEAKPTGTIYFYSGDTEVTELRKSQAYERYGDGDDRTYNVNVPTSDGSCKVYFNFDTGDRRSSYAESVNGHTRWVIVSLDREIILTTYN